MRRKISRNVLYVLLITPLAIFCVPWILTSWCGVQVGSGSLVDIMGSQSWLNSLDLPSNNRRRHPTDDEFNEYFDALNSMGKPWSTFEELSALLPPTEQFPKTSGILSKMKSSWDRTNAAKTKLKGSPLLWSKLIHNRKKPKDLTKITIALVSCGLRHAKALVMLKSVVLFNQDAQLHVIFFGDEESMLQVAQDILNLKWTVNALGWDFTYELQLEWFPSKEWKELYRPCTTQRLFFPSLLPHIDSLLLLDTDTIAVSNLTKLWREFSTHMKSKKLAAAAANDEESTPGFYPTTSKLPYYGKRGLNCGVMLMNLTQMRAFNFEARVVATRTLYKEKLTLADQDIINILFHSFPEKVHQLDCSYNFNWVHCANSTTDQCPWDKTGGGEGSSSCFCNSTQSRGVRVVHGNSGTFFRKSYPFLKNMYYQFEKFDLLKDSPKQLFQNLSDHFKSLTHPCGPLTADILYRNAFKYFYYLEKLRKRP